MTYNFFVGERPLVSGWMGIGCAMKLAAQAMRVVFQDRFRSHDRFKLSWVREMKGESSVHWPSLNTTSNTFAMRLPYHTIKS